MNVRLTYCRTQVGRARSFERRLCPTRLTAGARKGTLAPLATSERRSWGEVRPPGGVVRLERSARETRRGYEKGGVPPSESRS